MDNRNAILLSVIALGAIAAFKFMMGQMVPYVPFKQAVKSGEYVQIIGSLDRGKGVTRSNSSIHFTIVDDTAKDSIAIDYSAEEPVQIEQAEKIVVIGSYDKEKGAFNAEKILTKCPSKYENKKK